MVLQTNVTEIKKVRMRWIRVNKSFETRHEKTCPTPNANNKGADQPAHPSSLISCLDSIILIAAKCKISRL